MKKISKVVLASALAVGLGLGGASMVGCFGQGGKTEPSIEVHTEFRSEYYIGETAADVAGGILIYTDESGKEKYVAIESDMISGFTATAGGEWNMIITYNDLTILYPYTVIEPEFAQIGVPYTVYMADAQVYYTLIFNENETISGWTSAAMPTLNNYTELLKEGSALVTQAQDMTYTKEIVDRSYVLTILGTEGTEIKFTITGEDTVEMKQTITSSPTPLVLNFKTIGSEDAALEYGAYYVSEEMVGSTYPWAILCINANGTIELYPNITEEPTAQNVEALVAAATEVGQVQRVNYTSIVEDGEFKIQLFSNSSIVINANGTLSMVGAADASLVFSKVS